MTKKEDLVLPKQSKGAKFGQFGLEAIGGVIPFAGGVISAIAGKWSDEEQAKVNDFFRMWIQMLKDEIKEQEITIIEIMARLDLMDEKIQKRLNGSAFQSLLRKSFRDWSGTESEEKRKMIRNILSNAAATDLASDDVIRLFLDWLKTYSELHFTVIGAIYNSSGISRGEIWDKIGQPNVREDSAEADLYKLLIRDLSTGGIIRQGRKVDYQGNYFKKQTSRKRSGTSKTMKSAFDREEKYELTGLGEQFVHYAMNELAPRIEYKSDQQKD